MENRQHDLRLRRQFSILVEWRWRALRTFPIRLVEGLNGESQEDDVRSWPAESATGPIKKIPHRGFLLEDA